MAIWDDVITERDKEVFKAAGWGKNGGFGKRPVVLVIDVIYNFCGEKPEPILEAVKKFRYCCGEEAWDGIYATQKLLKKARERNIPIIYTTDERRPDGFDGGAWRRKTFRGADTTDVEGHIGTQIVKEIGPDPEYQRDIVLCKKKPSAFLGTPVLGYLIDLQADTIILTGTTTSGCVRATCVDGASYNYHVIIPQECVWDRGQTSHKINLFDMQQKYGDVLANDEVIKYLDTIDPHLYDKWFPEVK